MTSILNMFGKSPIKPLQEHMEKVTGCVEGLLTFFEATFSEDWVQAGHFQLDIAQLENEADDIKREVRMNLPGGLFLSVSRADVLELVSMQDAIANRAKDVAGLVFGRQMTLPDEIKELFSTYLSRAVDATKQANKAIHELDELQETGFGGKEAEIVERMINELTKIEYETDILQVKIRQQLLPLEANWPPVQMMFIYKIVEWVGSLADKAQNVGDRLQLLLVR